MTNIERMRRRKDALKKKYLTQLDELKKATEE